MFLVFRVKICNTDENAACKTNAENRIVFFYPALSTNFTHRRRISHAARCISYERLPKQALIFHCLFRQSLMPQRICVR